MADITRTHTRLALIDLTSASSNFDPETNLTTLSLGFKGGESAKLSREGDDTKFTKGIGKWLIDYTTAANNGNRE